MTGPLLKSMDDRFHTLRSVQGRTDHRRCDQRRIGLRSPEWNFPAFQASAGQ